ncbi:hypothetical protein [Streptomyces sp. NPDC058671]|uniref:hypothetical protein n=1 Tax=Streptomyces sp. NPDC058671 TaxID=3346590 RepID=UPI003658A93A
MPIPRTPRTVVPRPPISAPTDHPTAGGRGAAGNIRRHSGRGRARGRPAGAAADCPGNVRRHSSRPAGRPDRARSLWGRLPERARRGGAFRLLEARLLLAEGRKDEARAVFDTGFEVADLCEGAEILGEVWARLTDEPLPYAYEFRMRPS